MILLSEAGRQSQMCGGCFCGPRDGHLFKHGARRLHIQQYAGWCHVVLSQPQLQIASHLTNQILIYACCCAVYSHTQACGQISDLQTPIANEY